jgi:hypothetical protein
MIKNIVSSYVVYIIYFLGIGMVSSGIVLMPFNALRYSIILSLGLLLFISGSVYNELVINRQRLTMAESIKLILVSLALAIGIGMISGGISHFKESPTYAAYLIPIGIILSFISFTIKNNYDLDRKSYFLVLATLLVGAILLYVALLILGNLLFPSTPHGGDIYKGH